MRVLGDVELPVSMLRVGDRVERGGLVEVVVGLSVVRGEVLITVGDEDLTCLLSRSFRALLRYIDNDGIEHRICTGDLGRVSSWQRCVCGTWEDE